MLLDQIARTGPFAAVPPERLRDLASHSAELSFASGRTVFAHGDEADCVFLVLEGTVSVFRDQIGKPMQLLGKIGVGELVGELCLFDEVRRTATARAASDCRLIRFPREALRRLLDAEPSLALRVQILAARRRNLNAEAALEISQKAEVRIRLSAPVRLRMADGASLSAELVNLSLGGMSLARVPASWTPGMEVRFAMHADEEPLPVHGRLAWREGDTVGIAFLSTGTGHERHVYRLLRKLGES